MAEYRVNRVRKETSTDGTHRHVAGVCTTGGAYYTRREVVASIEAGNVWKTDSNGYSARIMPISYCLHPSCYATPYIKTNPNSTAEDNLENLPQC